jgi:hypothetical protein
VTTLYFDVAENLAIRTWVLRNGPSSTSTPVDLTNASSVVAVIGKRFPTALKSCTFLADTTGTVSVMMLAADLTTAGKFTMKTRVTFNDGTIVDFPKPGYDEVDVGTASA